MTDLTPLDRPHEPEREIEMNPMAYFNPVTNDPRDRHRHIYGNRLTRGWGIGWGRLHGPLARTGFSGDRHLVVVEVFGRYVELVR